MHTYLGFMSTAMLDETLGKCMARRVWYECGHEDGHLLPSLPNRNNHVSGNSITRKWKKVLAFRSEMNK